MAWRRVVAETSLEALDWAPCEPETGEFPPGEVVVWEEEQLVDGVRSLWHRRYGSTGGAQARAKRRALSAVQETGIEFWIKGPFVVFGSGRQTGVWALSLSLSLSLSRGGVRWISVPGRAYVDTCSSRFNCVQSPNRIDLKRPGVPLESGTNV